MNDFEQGIRLLQRANAGALADLKPRLDADTDWLLASQDYADSVDALETAVLMSISDPAAQQAGLDAITNRRPTQNDVWGACSLQRDIQVIRDWLMIQRRDLGATVIRAVRKASQQ